MPNPTKLVNNVEIELTDEEVEQMNAEAEEWDLNLTHIRRDRNSLLESSDITQIIDYPLGSDSLEDWQTYRQELRDYMAEFDRQSTQTAWPKSPIITRIGQAAYDAEVAKEESGPIEGETARDEAERNAGYPGTGI